MAEELWKRDEIQSPCIKICVIHPQSQLCTGCLRRPDEIQDWSSMGDAARSAIMAELPARMSQLTKRRGGRAARLQRQKVTAIR
ncbi:MAG: DUF1289 domain-containing protein [Halocynthiibacter sp.]